MSKQSEAKAMHNETADDCWKRYQELYMQDSPVEDINAAYAKWKEAYRLEVEKEEATKKWDTLL